jgi:hypothetical protein
VLYRGPIIFKNFCFFLNSTQSWRPEGFGAIFSYCLLLFLHVKIFLPIMEKSQVAQKINTSIKHVVPKNQIFSDMFSIFKDGLSLGGKKTVINFFGLGPKKITPRCRAHFSKHFCNSSQNSISSLSW